MENERTIEKLLRRYAARRNEEAGAPQELRAFRRRQLQDEVIRRGRRSRHRRGGAGRQLLKFFIGAVAAAGVYLLVLRASWNWTESSKEKLARGIAAETALPPLPRDSLSFEPADQSGALPFVASGALAEQSLAGGSGPAIAGDASDPASTLLSKGMTNVETEVEGEAEAPAQVAASDTFAEPGKAYAAAGNMARFANNVPRTPAEAEGTGTTPVLSRFRMEQNGNELRVVDADGSVYAGSVQLAAVPAAAPVPATEDRLARGNALGTRAFAPAAKNNNLNFTFRVSGTNRTLKEQVVFIGNLISESNAITAGAFRFLNNTPSATNELPFPSLKNAVVNGRAEVGTDTKVEINAAPVLP